MKKSKTKKTKTASAPIQRVDVVRGRYAHGPVPGISPFNARHVFAKRVVNAKSLSEYQKASGSAIQAFAAQPGTASNTVQTPVSTVAELARALKDDVDLIFYHVYNNIDFHPTFGLQKGSNCRIDGIGNAFDQCQLLVDLLTEAGYTASFLYGELDLSTEEVSAWLGCDSSSVWQAYYVLANGGFPVEAVWTGSEYRIEVSHVWVKVTIDSVDYVLDPAFKSYSSTTGINLATAMSYSQSSFLDEADDGATIDTNGNWIKDVNEGNIGTELSTYTDNLIDYIKTNNPTATMDDIIGGRTINKISSPVRDTSHPHQKSGQTPTSWSSIPNTHRITVRYQYDGFDETLYGDEINLKRVTFFFNGSNEGELRVDGTLIATSNAQTNNSTNSLQVTITHPYPVAWYDANIWFWLRAPYTGGQAYYLIASQFGATNESLASYHQNLYEVNKFAGSALDEPVLGERLAKGWSNWLGQLYAVADILGRMTNSTISGHHYLGLTILYDDTSLDTFNFDVQSGRNPFSTLDTDTATTHKGGISYNMHGYCLEQLAIQQMTGNQAMSATTVLQAANAAGDKIFKGTASNWSSDVTPNLSGYNGTDLTNIYNWYLDNGWYALISENAPVTIGSYDCTAWAVINPDGGALGVINATYGGIGEDDDEPPCECPEPYSFTYRTPGILLGSSPHPLPVEPIYNSSARFQTSTSNLGLGWRLNWEASAREVSAGFKGLGVGGGGASAFNAAVSIVEMFVHLDLLEDTDYPILESVVGSLCNSWWADQLTNNAVVLQEGHDVMEFIRLPDGSYQPPAGDASTLVKNMDGSYTLTTKHQVVKEFDTDGNLETIEYPSGVTITLTYSGGKLSTVSNGMGRTLTFSYTSGKLSSVSDGNGRSISFSYDVDDQLESITDPLGEDITFSYSDDGLMESYFLPENPTTPMVTNTFDSADRIESQLDVNSQQTKFYFAGWRTEIENALGDSVVMEYDHDGNLIKHTDEEGNITLHEYDGLNRLVKTTQPEGNSVSLTYDAKHNVLTSTSSPKPGSGLSDIVETFTYHSTFNKVATHEDGRGNTTTYSYNATTGNLETIERPDIGLDTPTVTMTYNGRGQVLTVEDETGIVTKFEYDTTTEVLEKITADEGVGRLNLVTELGYNAWGDATSVKDPRGNTTTRTFDAKRRLTQIVASSPFSYVTNITYDKNDNRLTIERQTGDGGHPWQVFEATYNVANQIATIKDPLNKTLTKQYDSLMRLWKETDPVSRVTEYQYDERGNLKKMIDPNSVEAAVYTYTANGLQDTVEDANGNVTQYVYDGFDRIERTVYPDGSFEQVESYDGNSNITSAKNRAGNSTTFQFDVLNRVTQRAPSGMPTVTMAYDLAGRLTSLSTPVVTGNPASGEWEYGFDTAGRMTSEEAPDGKTVSYELDANGNVTKITYPDTYYVERVYDVLNRLTDIKLNGASTPSVEFDYDDLSRRSQMTFDNGVVTDYGFEWNDNLSSIENAFTGSDLDFAYGFNDASELTSQSVSDSQHMWHPTTDSTKDFGTANNLNQMPYSTASCGRLFKGYNKNGCLTDDGVWKYEYDNENQLISADDGTTSVDYVYDSEGRQLQKDVDGTKTRYVYSGWQRIADYDGTSDTLQNRYVYGDGLDEPLIKVSSGGVLTYMHADSLGTIVALTDNTGAVTNRYAYSPWGESDSMSGTTFGYTGQRYDSETGLYYYKNRYYSPELGIFLQVDPIGYAGGLNLYSYVGNRPTNYTDSLGLIAGKGYSTMDDAAKAAYLDVNYSYKGKPMNLMGFSKAMDKEYGFLIYRLPDGQFTHTNVHGAASQEISLKEWSGLAYANHLEFSQVVAMGHTHPHERPWHDAGVGYSTFSPSDIEQMRLTQKVIYIGTSAYGQIRKRTIYSEKNKDTLVWPLEAKPKSYYLPGGFYTVVVDPGCSCKKGKSGRPMAMPRTPGANPNKGIHVTGVPMLPQLQAVAGHLNMSGLSGIASSTSVTGSITGMNW